MLIAPMLPKDLLDRVPTLNELLEHPRVREVAESWNESTLVTRARSALMELGSEISRRSESWSEASPRELLDRVLHLIDRPDTPSLIEVINGTGRLSSASGWKQVPLAEEVIAYAAQHASSFALGETASSIPETRFKRLTKAESALVTSSYVTAHEAFLGSFSRGEGQAGTIVVGRPDIGSIEPDCRFLTLCESNHVKVIEVGAAQQATTNDYLDAIKAFNANKNSASKNPNQQLWVYLGTSLLDQLTAEATALGDFIVAVHKQNAQLAIGLDDAAPCELHGSLDCSLLSASRAIVLGADLVLLRGSGMVGGPSVGLLAGKKQHIEAVGSLAEQRHWLASDWDKALTEATLTLFEQPERLPFRHPIASLLDTPLDNLRTRAERLAQLIDASDALFSAEPIELIDRQVGSGLQLSNSWGIKLTPSGEGEVSAFVALLRNSKPALSVEARNDGFIIDLRSVMPSQDQQTVCVVSGLVE